MRAQRSFLLFQVCGVCLVNQSGFASLDLIQISIVSMKQVGFKGHKQIFSYLQLNTHAFILISICDVMYIQ